MDYSKFLDEDFDVKQWVNGAFASTKEQGVTKDQCATTLVMKLQMFIQEVNHVIEEASAQAINNLPRVMRDIEAVKQEAGLLQDQMASVKHDIQKVEHDTAQSMQTLLKLDAIKSRMTSAADALKEADNWSTLSVDVEEVFESKDIQAITSKLVGMQSSLQMLVHTPDYADRCEHLEKLKNRLEAMLSPQLMAAFNTQSIEAAQKFTEIFESIDRLPQLYKFYNMCHKDAMIKQWKTINVEKSAENLEERMNELYDLLLSTWHTQMKWCSQIFTDPVLIVNQLVTDSLGGLDPPLVDCFTSHLSQQSQLLDALTGLKLISERFANSIQKASEPHMKDDMQYSRSIECLLVMIYSPYTSYMLQYRKHEETCLLAALNNIPLDHSEVFETVQLLGQSVNKLFVVARKADERCLKLSNGTGYVGLIAAVKTYLSSYSKEFRRVLSNIKEKCRSSASAEDAEDWSQFQHALRVIQTCGELVMHLEELDGTVISSIMHSVGHVTHGGSALRHTTRKSPLHAHAALLLSNQDDVEALVSMVHSLQEGETASLFQDSLTDLHRLSEEVHTFGFDVLFAQVKGYLTNLGNMEVWVSRSAGGALTSDLPTFSLSPQEYMTKIGQFLMTLPQHLEPFTLEDNPALVVALKHGKLPYTEETAMPDHIADLWLESIARGIMHVLSEEILRIHELSNHGTKQLITDIDYLVNVLEDLGLVSTETLRNIEQLLKVPADTYHDLADTMPQRLAHAVSNMRHIEL